MITPVDNKEHNINNLEPIDISVDEESKQSEEISSKKELTIEQKLNANGLKTISIDNVSDRFKIDVTYVVQELQELSKEVFEKKQQALEKSLFIKNKVDELVASGKVQINKDEYEKSEVSVQKYADLLENIIQEIDNELFYFSQFLGDTMPATLIVPKWETNLFSEHFEKKMKTSKKYIKDMKKDLNVSYSRYCFGFDAQIRRIIYIESYLKTLTQA